MHLQIGEPCVFSSLEHFTTPVNVSSTMGQVNLFQILITLNLQGFEATGTPIHSRLTAFHNFLRSESLSYFPSIDIQPNDTTVTDRFQRRRRQTNNNTSMAMMTTKAPIANSICPSFTFCELGELNKVA